jgi:hypothetical protein
MEFLHNEEPGVLIYRARDEWTTAEKFPMATMQNSIRIRIPLTFHPFFVNRTLGGFGQRLHAFDDNRSIAHFMRIAEADSPIFEGLELLSLTFSAGVCFWEPICVLTSITQKKGYQ